VIAHRLVLAAKNKLFYQVLVDAADEDCSVILMPEHGVEEVRNMVEDFYDFKSTENAFNCGKSPVSDTEICTKYSSNVSKFAKLQLPISKIMKEEPKLQPFQFPSSVDIAEAPDEPANTDVSALPTAPNSDNIHSLILKAGSVLCPTYRCKVPGCQFSVQKSLLCIKGHILTEHWGNLG